MPPDLTPHEQFLMLIKNESLMQYYMRACGKPFFYLMLGAAVAAFILTFVVVRYGKGPTVGPALVLTTPAAFYLGLWCMAESFVVIGRIAEQSGVEPDTGTLIAALGHAMAPLLLGAIFSIPAFLTAVIGAIVRALSTKTQP
ncbi:MAG: hypothetical protein QM775_13920 [Pirellulales bacterium]